jgi:uncharacterized membrane protein YeaQ/YmgE (transglycosylase-associated protein family)
MRININLRLITTVLASIILGVIGNFVYTFIVEYTPEAAKFVTVSIIPWSIVGVLIIALLVVLYVWQYDRGERDRMLGLADTTLRLLPGLICEKNDQKEKLHKLVKKLLEDVYDQHSSIRRAILLLPDEQEKDYLKIFEQFGWGMIEEEYADLEKFYIGTDHSKQTKESGLAGKSYLKQEMIITHLSTEEDLNKAKKDWYIAFDHEKDLSKPNGLPYDALICVPILFRENKYDPPVCKGVLCIDSHSANAFDSPTVKERMEILARHIGVALIINEKLHNIT